MHMHTHTHAHLILEGGVGVLLNCVFICYFFPLSPRLDSAVSVLLLTLSLLYSETSWFCFFLHILLMVPVITHFSISFSFSGVSANLCHINAVGLWWRTRGHLPWGSQVIFLFHHKKWRIFANFHFFHWTLSSCSFLCAECRLLFFQFFVASDPTVKNDRLWHDKYSLRKSMIPSFLSFDQAGRVSHLKLFCWLDWHQQHNEHESKQ